MFFFTLIILTYYSSIYSKNNKICNLKNELEDVMPSLEQNMITNESCFFDVKIVYNYKNSSYILIPSGTRIVKTMDDHSESTSFLGKNDHFIFQETKSGRIITVFGGTKISTGKLIFGSSDYNEKKPNPICQI